MTTYFHRTTRDAAAAILSEGFRDSEGSYMLATTVLRGVFVADQPLDENEGANGDALLIVEIEQAEGFDYFEIVEKGTGYREWCVPAEILNAGTVRHVSPEEEEAYWRARWAAPD